MPYLKIILGKDHLSTYHLSVWFYVGRSYDLCFLTKILIIFTNIIDIAFTDHKENFIFQDTS